jgi:peptide/nickel transport system substrate-binding protein
MRRFSPKLTTAVLIGCALALGIAGQASAATPKRGGILNFVVGSKIPSYDLHKETTFGVIHPIAPFYSLLIRINPENPQSATDFVCDLCEGSVPKPTNGGKTYTFKIQKGVKFHNGRPLTAKDVLATYQKIIFPPDGVPSARKAFFKMVSSVTSPDEYTVIFNLQFPSGAFIPALATPFNIVMSKEMIDQHGMSWYAKNMLSAATARPSSSGASRPRPGTIW